MGQETVVAGKKGWTREKIETTLKEILIDSLGVDEERIVPEASLVHDLGAESIDFLDIGFKVQQIFGVELPNKAIQEKAMSWRNLDDLRAILEERYGARIAAEEVKQIHTMGLPDALQWLAEKQGIAVHNGEAEKIARQLADRLAKEVASLGFKSSLIDREGTTQLLLRNLNSPKIMEGMIRLFSVGALEDFINSRVGEEAVEGR